MLLRTGIWRTSKTFWSRWHTDPHPLSKCQTALKSAQYGPFFFSGQDLMYPGWPPEHYDLEFLILLSFPQVLGLQMWSPHSGYVVLSMELMALCILESHSINWSTSPALEYLWHISLSSWTETVPSSPTDNLISWPTTSWSSMWLQTSKVK